MRIKLSLGIILFPMLFILNACSSGADEFTYDDIQGKWKLIEAQRNGISTTTFQKAIFTFSPDSIFTTNIPALENLGKVQLDGNNLILDDSKMDNSRIYLIDSTGQMRITADIMHYKFVFLLKRK